MILGLIFFNGALFVVHFVETSNLKKSKLVTNINSEICIAVKRFCLV